MVNSEKRQLADDRCTDTTDQNSDGEESVDVSLSGVGTPASANPSISRRLTEIFLEDGDEDLFLQKNDKEDGVLQWLRTLDMQVMGACRADERLKPMLKLNVFSGEAEDRLLAHLGQVCMLDQFRIHALVGFVFFHLFETVAAGVRCY